MILDFTITTCLRPDILRRTLESFRENLKGVEWGKCRAFVNVDPVGDCLSNFKPAYETFGEVHYNHSATASFPAAVKWCFAQPQTPFAFHLEDDWLLTERIDIDEMVSVMGGMSALNLRAYPFRLKTNRLFLSPGLWRTAMMHAVSEKMNSVDNPEVQLWRITDREQCGWYWPDHIVIQDIGREWLASSGFRKNVEVAKGVNPFTKWVSK